MTKEEFANLEIKVSISDFINVLSLVDHLAYSCNADALRDALQISTDIKLKAVSLIAHGYDFDKIMSPEDVVDNIFEQFRISKNKG